MVTSTIKKWGNSLAVRIPTDIAKSLEFVDGTEVRIEHKDNQIVITPVFPEADDQEALRALFLRLRSGTKPGSETMQELFADCVGDEHL
ncbi:AbrB/MazE/SpoVT family DNA-binding domain-containing protein [Paenibacillus campi]|uniref:AbrB/MazE/SpoVT family DNA-binding domain-containing protein n=1 Tax=Paenibacillus campi TaxID=3106031 RepID=UPI002AFF4458|nr:MULTISPECIES: AbrB/MazE/SpoVT family DNA-binding domain-containing protein [unclassified Paenibacillus]